ncbi:MAG: NAD-dependent epimerase/dehydratase family protein [candidate division Zixibacteria bacterium]|nr:NAD-dependent epimerase/dehydratase family protein [candidate division Zixibacteria bacterium]
MRILIIGGTRFSGPFVVKRLFQLGHEVAVFHRGESEGDLPDAVQHFHGDRKQLMTYADDLRRFSPDVIVDMIAGAEQDAGDVMTLFKGIARRAVVISSQDVYRAYGRLIGIEPGPLQAVPLTEDAPLRTRLYPYRSQAEGPESSFYHYEKILVERVYMNDPRLPGTVLRLPMVYGPGDHAQHRLFPYLKRMDDGRPVILLAGTLAAWRWTKGYVENVAAAIALAVTDERAAGRVYNVGERKARSEAAWVRAIGKVAGWDGKVLTVPDNRLPAHLAHDVDAAQHLTADTSRVRRDLGYSEPVDDDEALLRAVAWERAHPPAKIDPKLFDYTVEDALLAELADPDGPRRTRGKRRTYRTIQRKRHKNVRDT